MKSSHDETVIIKNLSKLFQLGCTFGQKMDGGSDQSTSQLNFEIEYSQITSDKLTRPFILYLI